MQLHDSEVSVSADLVTKVEPLATLFWKGAWKGDVWDPLSAASPPAVLALAASVDAVHISPQAKYFP